MTKRTATKTVAKKPVTKKTSAKAQRRTVTAKMTPKLPAAVKKKLAADLPDSVGRLNSQKTSLNNNPTPRETPMNESGMFFVDATYDNSDAKCSRDDEIVLLIQNNCGEVRGRDDCCGNQRCICGCFPGRFGAERAVRALEALGIETDLREDEDFDDGPESTLLAVEYSRGDPWIPKELVALLTFDLCVGWQHVSRADNEAILVDCRSIAAATYLKHKIDTGPLDRWVFAFFIPDEQPEPSVKD
jgi:hypothetical protein